MNFLLVYYIPVPYENCNRIKTCQWFEREEEMYDFIAEMKEQYPQGFVILDSIEILQERNIYSGCETERTSNIKPPIIKGLGQKYCQVCGHGGADYNYCQNCGTRLK